MEIAVFLRLIHLSILGLAGMVWMGAVAFGKNPLVGAPPQIRRLTVLFWVIFLSFEMLEVWEGRAQVSPLLTTWALIGLLMALLATVLMLTRRGDHGKE